MKKYLAEALGTFALVFFGCGAVVVNETGMGNIGHIGISVVFGAIVMIMIYSLGNVSGAHFNPAVTAGFFVSGKIELKESLIYIGVQIVGAVAASLVLRFLFQDYLTLGTTTPSGGVFQSFILEIILTFILMTVILNVSTGHMEKGIMAGIAIGSFVFVAAAVGGPLSGASMNPARTLGPAIAAGDYSGLWVYITAPFIGAAAAVPIFRIIQNK